MGDPRRVGVGLVIIFGMFISHTQRLNVLPGLLKPLLRAFIKLLFATFHALNNGLHVDASRRESFIPRSMFLLKRLQMLVRDMRGSGSSARRRSRVPVSWEICTGKVLLVFCLNALVVWFAGCSQADDYWLDSLSSLVTGRLEVGVEYVLLLQSVMLCGTGAATWSWWLGDSLAITESQENS